MPSLKAVAVGAGYFSGFHFDAWNRIPEVELVAVCDLDEQLARTAEEKYAIPRRYSNYVEMLDTERPDFVDVITPPATHLEIVQAVAARGMAMICQKPLAPTLEEAKRIAEVCAQANVRCMVHENFRFQPWHREIKRLLDSGILGDRLHTLTFRTRTGDGWGEQAYLDRQPYFRTMPRLLVYETGIHFIDTFRYLAGDVESVFCKLRKLNPVIAGEDCGLLMFDFVGGAVGVWDANRYNEPAVANPRYTFGELLLEGNGGTIRLAHDGTLTLQLLGQPQRSHTYTHSDIGFGGDCVWATQRHFVDRLLDGEAFETDVKAYMTNLVVQEALYESAKKGVPILLA